MSKSIQNEAETSDAEVTGTFRIVRDFTVEPTPIAVSSQGRVITGSDAQSYIPVVKDASLRDSVAVVISIKTPEEQFMEWANNWLEDEPQPQVDSD